MTIRSAVLLAIGTLVLGLLLGLATGGVAGFFAGQSMRATVTQNVQPLQRFNQQNPQPQNPQDNSQPQQPQQQPQQVQPQNPQQPFNRRGNGGNGGNLQPSQTLVAGAQITDIDPTSPAATAGLQVGDTITAVDNTPVDANHALTDLISAHKPGDTVTLAVTRGNQNLTLKLTLGQSPNDNTQAYMGIRFAMITGNNAVPRFQNPGGNTNPRFQNPGGSPQFQNPGSNFPNG